MAVTHAQIEPIDREGVALALREIGKLEIHKSRIELEMNQALDAIKTRYNERLLAYADRIERAAATLEQRCTHSRRDLLKAKAKRLVTLFGFIGWRSQPAAVKLRSGERAADVGQRLHDSGHDTLVITSYAPDRQAIKRAVDAGSMDVSCLRRVGLDLIPAGDDAWHYQVDRAKVEADLAGARQDL